MTIDAVEVPVHDVSRRRGWIPVVVVGLALAAAALILGFSAMSQHGQSGLSAPIFSASDGLPTVLDAGAAYTATMSVALPADWSDPSMLEDRPFIFFAMIEQPGQAGAAILCSGAVEPADVLILSCPLVAPQASGAPVTITLGPREYVHRVS